MRVVAVVQARMGSSRLPGKAMMSLGGEPMLRRVLQRVRAAELDGVVLATTSSETDGVLAQLAEGMGVPAHRGSEHDVLARVLGAAEAAAADVVVRVTADCPFWAPEVGQLAVAAFLRSAQSCYVSNDTVQSGYPDGTDVEVFGRASLLEAHLALPPLDLCGQAERRDREHVTPWIVRNLPRGIIRLDPPAGEWKLSVDRWEDYEFARLLQARLQGGRYDLEHTLDTLRRMRAEQA